MKQEEIKVIEPVIKKHRHAKKHLNNATWFIVIAFTAALGYVAGTYHYQIEGAIGPVFGYKAYSGELDLSSVQATYAKLAANYDGTIDTKALIEGANSGLVAAAGDTYTVYMSASDATDFNNSLSGNIGGGIGAVIGLKNSLVTVMSVLDDNPAKVVGLQANDVVLKINDEETTGWTVDKAVSKIRGDEGTTVKLTILRGEVTKDYTITRAIINNPSVVSSITGELGTITISRFDDETGDLARTAAQNFINKGVKYVILDLRDNGGGYVEAAKAVAGLWLDNKIVVVEKSGDAIKDTVKTISGGAILANISTVVLVNGNSASASEIVAGALQDYDVAKLVGERTFGKGSVQELITLDGGAQLKVTVAKWYTPKGKNITKEGITPDGVVSLSQSDVDAGVDPQFNKAKEVLGL